MCSPGANQLHKCLQQMEDVTEHPYCVMMLSDPIALESKRQLFLYVSSTGFYDLMFANENYM